MTNLLRKALSALMHPRAAFARMTQDLDFSELLILKELDQSGLLSGITGMIDAGAHHGNYARVFSHVFPDVKIVCFEPIPASYQVLVSRTANNPLIAAHRLALGSQAKSAVMNVSGVDQASSLLLMTDTHADLWPKSATIATVDVEITTLDKFLLSNPISGELVLKMDVQGFELELLKGAVRSLPQIRVIRLEASFIQLYQNAPRFSEICCFLEGYGFRFFRIIGEIYGKSASIPVQADVLFIRV